MGWCLDYTTSGCCPYDSDIFSGYCLTPPASSDPLYPYACDYTSPLFGTKPLKLNSDKTALTDEVDHDDVYGYGFCTMLGQTQREWLRRTLLESKAEVRENEGKRGTEG